MRSYMAAGYAASTRVVKESTLWAWGPRLSLSECLMIGPERVVGPRKLIAERAALNAALNAGGCDSSGGFCRVDASVHAGGPSRKGLVAPDGAALKFGRPG